jgi:hypothetical protein
MWFTLPVVRRQKYRELRAAQPLALNQKEEKNFDNWHGPYVTSSFGSRPCEALVEDDARPP